MLATAVRALPVGDEWSYEMKWDGYRAIVGVADGRVRIVSRRGNDVSARFEELAELPAALGGVDAVLDGELVVLEDDGLPSFQAIQQHTAPAVLMCFDLLRLDGRDLMALPWTERHALLERLGLADDRWQTPPSVVGDGARVHEAAVRLGMEGVVAKRIDSPYRPGRRSSEWCKYRIRLGQELVVGGWLPGEGRLEGTLGSVLVGYFEPGGVLRYAGRVGSGIDERKRTAMLASFRERDTSPFESTPRLPGPVWIEPDVVVAVEFTEWTSDGVLRQPVFVGIRDDKDPSEVVARDVTGRAIRRRTRSSRTRSAGSRPAARRCGRR